jgi:hypothetical protein
VDKAKLPIYGGVYFVGSDNDPTAYIGQSQCLKSRFISHHRKEAFNQLVKEHGEQDIKIRYWKAPSLPKDDLQTLLIGVEGCLITSRKPKINCTSNSIPKTPCKQSRIPFRGPVYVQVNQLGVMGSYSIRKTHDSTSRCYLSLRKLADAENAARYRSPVFLISSGSWEDACFEFGHIPDNWKQYTTLYFLSVMFRALRVEFAWDDLPHEYCLSGNQATFHQVLLNELPGFKDFSIRYLHTGFTNCSQSAFCSTLFEVARNDNLLSLQRIKA